ncbi:leucine-rich repeat extensin-like protein 5 [Myripristis murdjan]|uniref:leucine-rich repeat extensin-like protein 5 n=1 Tax=Myripristis murdjan TaxID=586833 RepID=UPI001175E570|nr:leucine-rich repeat extensin-like protein 5 [Myripristis murdjan]
MEFGFTFRNFWICFLLFGSGACYPATKGGYVYPYRPSQGYGEGSVTSGNSNSLASSGHQPTGSSSSSFVSLQHEPAAEAHHTSSPVTPGAPSMSSGSSGHAGPSSSYEPHNFLVGLYSSLSKPSSHKPYSPEPQKPSVSQEVERGDALQSPSSSGHVPGGVPYSSLQDAYGPNAGSAVSTYTGSTYSGGTSQSGGSTAGYVSPPVVPPSPTGSGQNSPSFSPQPEPATSAPEAGWYNSGSSYQSSHADVQQGDVSGPISEVSQFPSQTATDTEGFQYPAASENTGADFSYPSYGGASTYEFAPSEPGSSSFSYPEEPSSSSVSEWEEQPEVYAPAAGSYDPAPSTSENEEMYPSSAEAVYEPSYGMDTVPLPDPGFITQQFEETPQFVSEPYPTSYIIQSHSGYQRGRVSFTNTKYSLDTPQPPVPRFKPVMPHRPVSRPVSAPKGMGKA